MLLPRTPIIILACVAALCGCARRTSVLRSDQRQVAPPPAEDLTAEIAQQALAKLVEAHPDVFVSPGRAETAQEILNAKVGAQTTGVVGISWFRADLDQKTYRLAHHFEKPGWFEHWVWEGAFRRNPAGQWEATKPDFEKSWGE
jgi:hypothetical protein